MSRASSLAAATLLLLFSFVGRGRFFTLASKFDSVAGHGLRTSTGTLSELFLVDHVDHGHESVGHVGASLRTRLEILHVVVRCELLGLLARDHAIGQVALVADEQSGDVRLAVLVHCDDPSTHRLERLLLGHVETDHHSLRLLVEGHCE